VFWVLGGEAAGATPRAALLDRLNAVEVALAHAGVPLPPIAANGEISRGVVGVTDVTDSLL
jgi:hypothetical protein